MHTLCSIGLHNFLSLCTETLTNIYLHIYLRLVIYSSGTLGVSFLFISQICRLSMRRSGKPCTREQVSISFKLKMHSNKGSRSPRVYRSLLSVHPSFETRVIQTALGLSNTHDVLPRGSLTSKHEHLFSTYIHRNVFQSYFGFRIACFRSLPSYEESTVCRMRHGPTLIICERDRKTLTSCIAQSQYSSTSQTSTSTS